jgi:hypothetical protein
MGLIRRLQTILRHSAGTCLEPVRNLSLKVYFGKHNDAR